MNTTNTLDPAIEACHCCERPFNDARPATNLCIFAGDRSLDVGFGLLHYDCAEKYFGMGSFTWSLNDSSVVTRDSPLPKSKKSKRR